MAAALMPWAAFGVTVSSPRYLFVLLLELLFPRIGMGVEASVVFVGPATAFVLINKVVATIPRLRTRVPAIVADVMRTAGRPQRLRRQLAFQICHAHFLHF